MSVPIKNISKTKRGAQTGNFLGLALLINSVIAIISLNTIQE